VYGPLRPGQSDQSGAAVARPRSAVLAGYPLQVRRLRLVQHSHNATFRVATIDGHHYALRTSGQGFHTREEVTSEMLWLMTLRRDTSLEVPEPIPTRAGDLVMVAQAPGESEPRLCAPALGTNHCPHLSR